MACPRTPMNALEFEAATDASRKQIEIRAVIVEGKTGDKLQ